MKKTVILIIVCLVFLAGCAQQEKKREKIVSVKVLELKRKTIRASLFLSGSVDSKAHSFVTAPVEGTMQTLNAIEGDKVSFDEILGSIMPQDQQDMLGQAKADLEIAKKSGDEKAVQEAALKLESAKKLYKPLPLVSPINGVILSKNVELGSNVTLKQVIFEIADMHQLIIRSAVFEKYVAKIRLGQEIQVIVHSNYDKPITGILTEINPGISLDSRTANIEVSIPSNENLKPGMSASLDIVTDQVDNAVVIPQDSIVLNPEGETIVYVVQENKKNLLSSNNVTEEIIKENESDKKTTGSNLVSKLVKVTTGIESNTEIEITSGLKEGDKLVVLGQDLIEDGAKVKILNK